MRNMIFYYTVFKLQLTRIIITGAGGIAQCLEYLLPNPEDVRYNNVGVTRTPVSPVLLGVETGGWPELAGHQPH